MIFFFFFSPKKANRGKLLSFLFFSFTQKASIQRRIVQLWLLIQETNTVLFCENWQKRAKHQLVNFLSLFSARLATLFCGSRTRACLKSANKKKVILCEKKKKKIGGIKYKTAHVPEINSTMWVFEQWWVAGINILKTQFSTHKKIWELSTRVIHHSSKSSWKFTWFDLFTPSFLSFIKFNKSLQSSPTCFPQICCPTHSSQHERGEH